MTIERKDTELLVRISLKKDPSDIQAILDYLKYEELTSKSEARDVEIQLLAQEAKAGRWGRVKKETGMGDENHR